MTTEVTIKYTDNGHHMDVMVNTLNQDGTVVKSDRLSDEGDEVSIFVYDTQSIAIREVRKENDQD